MEFLIGDKHYATVKVGTFNLAAMVIFEGLATLVRPATESEPRSSEYQELVTAGKSARKQGMGMFGKNNQPKFIVKVMSAELYNKYLPLLQNSGRMRAVVEKVLPDWQFILFSPQHQFLIRIVLSDLSTKDYNHDARVFLQKTLLQREIKVKILDIDTAGTYIGGASPRTRLVL